MKISTHYPTVKSKPLPGARVQGGATADMFGAGQARSLANASKALMQTSNNVTSAAKEKKREQERLLKQQKRDAEKAQNRAEKAANKAAKSQYLQHKANYAVPTMPSNLESLFGVASQNTENNGAIQNNATIGAITNSGEELVRFDKLSEGYIFNNVCNEMGLGGSGFTTNSSNELSINDAINFERPDLKEKYDEAIELIKEEYAPRAEAAKSLSEIYMYQEIKAIKGEIQGRLAKITKSYNDNQTIRRDSRLESATIRNASLFTSSIINNDPMSTLKHNAIEWRDSIENFVDNKYQLQDEDELSRQTRIQEKAFDDAKTKIQTLLDGGKIAEARRFVDICKYNLRKDGVELFNDDMELSLNNLINTEKLNFEKAATTERANSLKQQVVQRWQKDPNISNDDLRKQATTLDELKAIDSAENYFKEHEKEIKTEQKAKAERGLTIKAEEMKYLEYGQEITDPKTGEKIIPSKEQILAHNEKVKKIRNNVTTPRGRKLEETYSKYYGEKLRTLNIPEDELEEMSPAFIEKLNSKRKAEETKYQNTLAWYEKDEDKGGPPEAIKDKINDLPEGLRAEAITKAFSMSNKDGHVTHEEIIQNINQLVISKSIRRKANPSGVLYDVRSVYGEINRKGLGSLDTQTRRIPASKAMYNYAKSADPEVFDMLELSDNPSPRADEWEDETTTLTTLEADKMIEAGDARRDITELSDKDMKIISSIPNAPNVSDFTYSEEHGYQVADMGSKYAIYDGKGVRFINKKAKK